MFKSVGPLVTRYRSLLLAAAAVLLVGTPPDRAAAALSKHDQACVNKSLKAASNVTKAFSRSAAKCVKTIGKGQPVGDAATCTMANPKIASSESKLTDTINASCTYPFPIDCPPPCDATDAGGATTGVDDDTELADCFNCMGASSTWSGNVPPGPLQGFNGALYQTSTIYPSSNQPIAGCQNKLVKFAQRLFLGKIKFYIHCVQQALAGGATSPPSSCIADGGNPNVNPVIGTAASKIASVTNNPNCTPGPPFIFDNDQCANLDGQNLADCVERIAECKYCNLARVLIGDTSTNCDLFDDGLADGSCTP